MDIIVKSCYRDLYTYLQLQRDILENCRLNGEVNVIVPSNDFNLFKINKTASFNLFSDEDILAKANYQGPYYSNWYTQQVVKLAACSYLNGDTSLILDSNTLINKTLLQSDFKIDEKYIYEISDFNDEDLQYEKASFEYLGFESKFLGIRNVNQVFMKKHVRGLLSHIEKRYSANPVQMLMNTAKYPLTQWTEFHLYGIWIDKILAPEYLFQKKNALVTINWKYHSDKLPHVLNWIKIEQPITVKFYKVRNDYLLSDRIYDDIVSKIKLQYVSK